MKDPLRFKETPEIEISVLGKMVTLQRSETMRVRITNTKGFEYDARSNWLALRGYHSYHYTNDNVGYGYFMYRNIEFWVEKSGNGWHITERSTGCRIGMNQYKPQEAVDCFLKMVKSENVWNVVVNRINEFLDADCGIRIQPYELLSYGI